MPYDTVRAVLACGAGIAPIEMIRRAQAFEQVRYTTDFDSLSVAAKRIRNILAKSDMKVDMRTEDIEEDFLVEEEEKRLYRSLATTGVEAFDFTMAGQYVKALEKIASLRPAVDTFFDKVLVMAEDLHLRRNRLRLLTKLDGLFRLMLELSEIVQDGAGAETKPNQASTSRG